jgi:hypothetical protein
VTIVASAAADRSSGVGVGSATVLVIGGPAAGKTHFGAQLLARLSQRHDRLRMRAAPSNIAPFESTLLRLGQGMAAAHTPTEQFAEITLPVTDNMGVGGRPIDLVWPDYGGEQIDNMLRNRRIPSNWHERLTSSDGWLLFVRLQHAHVEEDMLSRPPSDQGASGRPALADFRWSHQARLVELLQLLLFVKGVGTIHRIRRPALTILASCWDEITGVRDGATPGAVLAERMPLLASFAKANWAPGQLSVVGLSSLGKALRADAPDEEYLSAGPEAFGYVVLPNGQKTDDLTVPVAELALRAC